MDPFAIQLAAMEGDLHKVRQLMEVDASMDSRNEKGRTPVLLAAEWGHHEVVKFLISCKLDPLNRKPPMLLDIDLQNYTLILLYASCYGWADIAQIIIEKGSQSDMVNAATSCGRTPLMEAAFCGRDDVAALLLRSGADVNRRDTAGFTALHQAAQHGHVTTVKLLLQEEGLELSPQEEDGWTPLHYACWWGNNCEVIKQLLVAGADTNLNNRNNNETPLSIYLKAQNPSLEIINLFLQCGAFFQDSDYSKTLENPVLRENVLKNVDLCAQSVINKFSYQTLPALYSSPYFARKLPSMDTFMLNTSQKDEVKNFVMCDIEQNAFCNVVRARPTALSALCIQSLATYITSHK